MPSQGLINNRYELKDTLGQGGMGVVYRAWDSSTRRDVALKTMHDAANPLAVELFSKEWNVLANICHPNIVDILDCGEFQAKGQRRPYFVMPLLPGKTLEQLIHSSSQRLTVTRLVEILRQTCRGLQAAHERNLVHRDLKPSNIFVMEDDTAKIIDFGVVHLTGSQSFTGLKGTVQYMAPEQLELKPATAQSDIFSLGVVAYEALTGRKPFARKTEAETIEAVRLHIPPAASEINPAAGDQISRVIHKAMAKQAWNRFATAREFGDMLDKALRGEIVFDASKIRPRIELASKAFKEGDLQFSCDILNELEAEGNIEPEMAMLRLQIDQAGRQRTIRQLLESARTRLEQEEYPLALQKVQEVLRLDAGNAEALGMRAEIENQRSERQVENWLRLAREHLSRGAFAEARRGLEEALQLNRQDTRISQLLNDLSRQEQENSKARTQKEQLYEAARQAFQNGEISTALSKLERVLELNRRNPDRTSPERDALYQNFYNQVRSENDANRISYEDARRYLGEKEFAKARALCEENLKRYPGQALFQALKLEIDEQERQELYSYIAETARRLDAEPDLDRKLNIAKEAADRYPNEPQFKQSLKLVRDRRDLVSGIVAKSRQCEERGQFAEALGQWEILRGIYPQYPGLSFEIEQLKRRRDQQSREETKGRWVEQTDSALSAGDFEQALEYASEGLQEFPNDPELTGLERHAREGLARRRQAGQLLAEGERLCASNRFDEGLSAIRQASELDRYDANVRAALINALTKRAQELMTDDWAAAEPLVQHALDLDSANSAAKSLRAQIQDHRRRSTVDRCLAEARDLRNQNDQKGALAKVESGLKLYPNEYRLLQFKATLQKEDTTAQWRKQRSEDLLQLRRLSEEAEHVAEPAALDSLFARSVALSEKYTDDAEFGSLTQLLRQRASATASSAAPAAPTPATAVHAPSASRRPAASAVATPVPEPVGPAWPPPPPPPPPRSAPPPSESSIPASLPKRKPVLLWAGLAAIPVVLLGVFFLSKEHVPNTPKGPTTKPIPPSSYPLQLAVAPAGADIQIDGQPVTASSVNLSSGAHTVAASLLGYHAVSQTINAGPGLAPLSLTLEPEPQHLEISTGLPTGKVLFDGAEAGSLQLGQFSKDDITPGDHTIQIVDQGRELMSLRISAAAARAPQLSSPVKGNVIVVTRLGDHAHIYSGSHLQLGNAQGQSLQPIPEAGVDVPAPAAGDYIVTDGKHPQTVSLKPSNYPLLEVYANLDTDTRPVLSIAANVDDVQLSINGKPAAWRAYKGKLRGRLDPGIYDVKVSKPGYQDAEQTVTLAKGAPQLLNFELKALPVFASLSVEEGTPGAEVLIDESPKGTIDANGKLSVESLAAGYHSVIIRKENFEPKTFRKPFVANQPLKFGSAEAKLVPYGELEFNVTPGAAKISFKRADDSEPKSAENNRPVTLPEGEYMVEASADGYEPGEGRIHVSAGNRATFGLALKKTVSDTNLSSEPAHLTYVEDPSKWQAPSSYWIVYTGQGYGWLKGSAGTWNVDVHKKAGGVFSGGGIEFVVGYAGKNKITYRIGKDGWLTHRVTVNGKTDESPNSARLVGEDSFHLQITVEPDRVVVRDAKGSIADSCPVSGFDVTAGKFGFKSGIYIHVSR